ncbi:hypothetical protein ACFX2F_009843 [Malus domestica]
MAPTYHRKTNLWVRKPTPSAPTELYNPTLDQFEIRQNQKRDRFPGGGILYKKKHTTVVSLVCGAFGHSELVDLGRARKKKKANFPSKHYKHREKWKPVNTNTISVFVSRAIFASN